MLSSLLFIVLSSYYYTAVSGVQNSLSYGGSTGGRTIRGALMAPFNKNTLNLDLNEPPYDTESLFLQVAPPFPTSPEITGKFRSPDITFFKTGSHHPLSHKCHFSKWRIHKCCPLGPRRKTHFIPTIPRSPRRMPIPRSPRRKPIPRFPRRKPVSPKTPTYPLTTQKPRIPVGAVPSFPVLPDFPPPQYIALF